MTRRNSERLLAEALRGYDDALIMTKGGHFRTGYREWAVDNSPGRLRADVAVSLAALGVDRIGTYFLVPRFPALAALAAARGQTLQRLLLRALLDGAPSASVVVGARRPATAIDSAKVPSDPWGDVERAAYDQDISASTD